MQVILDSVIKVVDDLKIVVLERYGKQWRQELLAVKSQARKLRAAGQIVSRKVLEQTRREEVGAGASCHGSEAAPCVGESGGIYAPRDPPPSSRFKRQQVSHRREPRAHSLPQLPSIPESAIVNTQVRHPFRAFGSSPAFFVSGAGLPGEELPDIVETSHSTFDPSAPVCMVLPCGSFYEDLSGSDVPD